LHIDALVYIDRVRALVKPLPGIGEGICYGTPGFYVQKKLFARLKEDGETLVVYTQEREKWMKATPAVYYITDHYLNYPCMLVRLGKVRQKELETLLIAAWRMRATKGLIAEYDAGKGASGKRSSGPHKK